MNRMTKSIEYSDDGLSSILRRNPTILLFFSLLMNFLALKCYGANLFAEIQRDGKSKHVANDQPIR